MNDKNTGTATESRKDAARRAFLKKAAALGTAAPAVALILSAGAKPARALQVSPD